MKPDLLRRLSAVDTKRFSRRTTLRRVFLHGGGLVLAAAGINHLAGGTAVSTPTTAVTEAVTKPNNPESDINPYGKYIYRKPNGEFTTTDDKRLALRRLRLEPRDIDVPQPAPDGRVTFARNTRVIFSVGNPQQYNVQQEAIQVNPKDEFYGLEVAGATYSDGQHLGSTKISTHTIGRWFLLTDSTGQAIDRQGRHVFYRNNMVYVSADQAVILPNTPVIPLGQKDRNS